MSGYRPHHSNRESRTGSDVVITRISCPTNPGAIRMPRHPGHSLRLRYAAIRTDRWSRRLVGYLYGPPLRVKSTYFGGKFFSRVSLNSKAGAANLITQEAGPDAVLPLRRGFPGGSADSSCGVQLELHSREPWELIGEQSGWQEHQVVVLAGPAGS